MESPAKTRKRWPCWLVGHRPTAHEVTPPNQTTQRFFVDVCEVCDKQREFYVNETGRHNQSGFYRG